MKYSRRQMLSLLAGNLALILAPKARAADDPEPYSAEELQEIVGPVALYPDSLLGHVLPASTMPDQVATALERLAANDGVFDENDEGLMALDENIQALLPFPDVLELLQDNDEWRAELGYAVVVQEGDVLDAIQAFRKKADESGNLQSDDHMTVTMDGPTILIQQADPQVVYVPVYEPAQVIIRQPAPVLTFTAAVLVGSFIWHGWGWGWGRPYYRSRYLGGRHGNRWHHHHGRPPYRPPHRPHRPVYRPKPNRPRPPSGNRPGSGWRPDRPGNGRPPSGNRPGSGSRPPGGRPPAGNRPPGGRPPAGNRPDSGLKPGGGKPPGGGRPPGGNRPNSGLKPGGGRPATRPSPGSRPNARPAQRPAPRSGVSSRKKGGAFEGVSRGGKSSRNAGKRGAASRGKAPRGSSRKKGR